MDYAKSYNVVAETEQPTPRIVDDLSMACGTAQEAHDRLRALLRRLRGVKPEPVMAGQGGSAGESASAMTPSLMARADTVRTKLTEISGVLDEIEKLV
jgi:hypothetical protein